MDVAIFVKDGYLTLSQPWTSEDDFLNREKFCELILLISAWILNRDSSTRSHFQRQEFTGRMDSGHAR